MKMRRFSRIIVAVFSWVIAQAAVSHAEVTVYRFAKLVDGTGAVLDGRDIAVENGRIVAVGHDLDTQHNGQLIDMGALVALPGLVDAHTHITYGLPHAPKGNAWAELGGVSREERLEAGKRNALLTLETGVTTVRDLNSDRGIDYELRDLINAGDVVGPRIFTSGPGLHPGNDPLPEGVREYTADFMREAAERRLKEGADWIKIFGTTGSASDLTSRAYFPAEGIKAAADAARAAGKRITVHSYGTDAVEGAIAANVTSLDHPVGLTNAHLDAMHERGIIYVPTVDHNRYYAQHAEEYGYSDLIKANLHVFVGRNLETVRRAHKKGLTIAMGSDAVLTGFGENTCELRAFVAAGMSNAEAIQTATINGARLMGKEEELGRLAVGYSADFIAVDDDPLSDINAIIKGVTLVVKEGQILVDHRDDGAPNQPNCGTLY